MELSDAGDGTVEIIITAPNGQLLPHQIMTADSSLLEVHYTPVISGIHRATVNYNGVPVPGSFHCYNCLLLNIDCMHSQITMA